MTASTGTYLGREDQIERLVDLLTAASAGSGAFVVLRGAAGSGTTTTARLIAARAPAKAVAVLDGAFVDGLRGRPFGALADALDGHARATGGATLRAELGDGAAALARIAPHIRDTLSAIPPPAPLEPADERLRLFGGYAGWLRRAQARQPLLVVLDDLQWADTDAVALLEHLLRGLPGQAVLLLATWADHRGPAAGPATEAATKLLDAARVIELASLDKGATGVLLSRIGGRPLSSETLALVQQHTSGQPLPAIELYRHLVDEGHVGRPGGDVLPQIEDLPRRLEDVVAWRAARLSLESRSALGALAVFPDGAPAALIAPVAGLSRARVVEALEGAVAGGLATIDDGGRRYAVSHERIRRALLATIGPVVRGAAYRRAAQVLEAETAADSRQLAPLLADLYVRSAIVEGAATGLRHLLLAAEQARAAAAFGRTADILLAATEIVGAEAERADVRLRLLQAQADAGFGDAATATAEKAFAVTGGGADVPGRRSVGRPAIGRRPADVQPLIAAARALRGHGQSGHVASLQELARRVAGTADRLTGARLDLLDEHWQPAGDDGPLLIWSGLDEAGERVLLREGDERDRADMFAAQRRRTHEQTVALLTLSREWRRPASLLAALRGASTDLLTRLGRWREAGSWVAQYVAAAERYGSVCDAARAQLFSARLRALLGELDSATEALAAADELIERLGDYADLRDERVVAALTVAHYRDGDWRALYDSAADAVAAGPRPAGLLLVAESALAGARLDDEGVGRPRVEAVLDTVERWPPLTYLRDEALLVALTAGWELGWAVHTVRGATLLEQAAAAGVGGNHAATIGLARTRLLALAGRLDEARAGFAAARTELADGGLRPLRAIVDHDEGVTLAAASESAAVEADALLRRALDSFTALGMDGWAARTQRLLDGSFSAARQPGGRLHFSYPVGLSRREADLVRLVSNGSPLADAAAALDLEPQVAERHLASALAKLGSDDPADLPRLARRHGLGGGG